MMRRVDLSAHQNHWQGQSGPVAVLCAGLMLCALLLPPWPGAPFVLAIAFTAAVAGARVPAGVFIRALIVPLGFLLSGAIVMGLSIRWEAGPRFGFAPSGLATAALAGARALAAAAVTLLYALTVPLTQQLHLLRRLRVPEALLDLMLLTYRTLFLLDDCQRAILRAQHNRLGYRNARLALQSGGLAAHALLCRAMARAARLERGLAARGYAGRLTVLLPQDRARTANYALASLLPLALAAGFVLLHHRP